MVFTKGFCIYSGSQKYSAPLNFEAKDFTSWNNLFSSELFNVFWAERLSHKDRRHQTHWCSWHSVVLCQVWLAVDYFHSLTALALLFSFSQPKWNHSGQVERNDFLFFGGTARPLQFTKADVSLMSTSILGSREGLSSISCSTEAWCGFWSFTVPSCPTNSACFRICFAE